MKKSKVAIGILLLLLVAGGAIGFFVWQENKTDAENAGGHKDQNPTECEEILSASFTVFFKSDEMISDTFTISLPPEWGESEGFSWKLQQFQEATESNAAFVYVTTSVELSETQQEWILNSFSAEKYPEVDEIVFGEKPDTVDIPVQQENC